jgi:hypothetical protein
MQTCSIFAGQIENVTAFAKAAGVEKGELAQLARASRRMSGRSPVKKNYEIK